MVAFDRVRVGVAGEVVGSEVGEPGVVVGEQVPDDHEQGAAYSDDDPFLAGATDSERHRLDQQRKVFTAMTIHRIEVPADSAVFGRTSSAFDSFGYAPTVRAHGLLFIAGAIGRRADGTIPETIEEQTEIAIGKIAEILRLDNLDRSALVDITSYHVDIHEHMSGFLAAKKRLVEAPYPTWTIIGVSGLASPGLLIEIRATAAYPDNA